MTRALRVGAFLIALAGALDPVVASRTRTPLPIDVHIPPAGDPGHAEAARIRDRLVTDLGDAATVDGAETPRAIVAIGDASTGLPAGVPLFGVRLVEPAAEVSVAAAPAVHAFMGQRPSVSALFRGRGVKGKTTTFLLTAPGGAAIGRLAHTWPGDGAFDARFPYAPAGPGLSVLRIVARTAGIEPAAADVPVVVQDRRARVLVYEPRPSWAAGFARQAIEADPLFRVAALARTSRGVQVRTNGAPRLLAAMPPDDVEAIVVGGLEALTVADVQFLQRFAGERGGAVILVPDGRLPERLRAAFDLPVLQERLVERPIDVGAGHLRLKASEILGDSSLLARSQGRGHVYLATGLDAWRYRGDGHAFSTFWRALVADAAAVAIPRLTVIVEPVLAPPGRPVTVTVRLRLPRVAGRLRLPAASASLIAADGDEEMVRLWPGTAAGEYVARFPAPPAGEYLVRVQAEGEAARDHVLAVKPDATTPRHDRSAAIAFLAESSGGTVMRADELPRLAATLRALERPAVERQSHPMRSVWWMLPFTGLLAAEWALRRRRGLR